MTTRWILPAAIFSLSLVFVSGCTSPTFWTDEVTEELRIDTKDLARLDLQTHNGSCNFEGRSEGEPVAIVKVTKKGGGMTLKDAQDALAAIEVSVQLAGGGAKLVAWKWRTGPMPSWSAQVAYNVGAPASLPLNVKTHNGSVTVVGAAADVKAVSHNGSVKVQSSGSRLAVETHNGGVDATFAGGELSLFTHNGHVTADLSKSKYIGGEITSYNGGISLTIGKELSTNLSCQTYNGGIDCDAPYKVEHASRHELVGQLGDGGPKLTVSTHNGSIKLK